MKLLCVDDSLIIHSRISKLIKDIGYENLEIVFGTDGLEALSQVKEFNPDVLILDHNMPYIEGCDLIESVLQKSPNLYIIICSSDKEAITRGLNLQVKGFILKPIDEENFSFALNSAIKYVDGLNSEN